MFLEHPVNRGATPAPPLGSATVRHASSRPHCDDDDDDDDERIIFSVALSPKTTRTRNNKPKQ